MFFLQKFSSEIITDLGLTGIIKIYSKFTVDKQGNIVNIGVRTPYKKLENEIIRVIKLLPKMTPGKMNGKAVNARFVIPIVIEIEE
jgi:protein TonB